MIKELLNKFNKVEKSIRDVYPDTLYDHSKRQVKIKNSVFNVGFIPGSYFDATREQHYVLNEKELQQAVEGV